MSRHLTRQIGKLLEWLLSNVGSMMLSLLASLTVWIAANQSLNPVEIAELDDPVEINVVGLDEGLIIVNDYPKTTRVTLRAQRNTWPSLSAEDIIATADLSGLGPGVHTVRLDIRVVAQAIVVAANPSNVRFELEEVRERTLPVQLVVNGDPATGYRVDEPVIDPPEVTVRGPRSRVELIGEIRAEVSAEGLREPLTATLPVVALDSDGNPVEGVTITPAEVDVELPILQVAGFREVAVRVDADVRPAPGYYVPRIIPEPQSVTVQGDPEVINDLLVIETQPIVLNDLTEDRLITVALDPPPGVSVVGTQTVDVRIIVAAQPGFNVVEVPLQALGLAEGLAAEFSPDRVVVSISGPLPILNKLNPEEDIIASVDLTDLGIGEYQIEPQVEIASGELTTEELSSVLVESVLPTLIDVRITVETRAPGQ